MGSSNSKPFDPETVVAGHRRSYSRNVIQSSCIPPGSPGRSDIGDHNVDHEQVSHYRSKENGAKENTSKVEGKTEQNQNVEVKLADERMCVSSELKFVEWGKSSLSDTVSRNGGSSSRNFSSFLSHFSLFPGNISSILSRTTSSWSSRADHESSTSSTISTDEELHHDRSGDRYKTSEGCELFPSCFMPMSPGPRYEDLNSDNGRIIAIQELARDTNDNRVEPNGNLCSPRNACSYDGMETRHVNGQNDARESVEQNFLVSRTPSAAFPVELPSCPFQPEREAIDASEVHATGLNTSNENAITSITSSSHYPPVRSNSLFDSQDFEVEIERAREIGYHYLLEHTANFIERRRRIRSERGSRFESQSGHESSCILSGQYLTGQCACRLNNQDPLDGTNAMGGTSRIIYMAEALFEVMDDMNEQSLALLSRPSLSLARSVPAPYEVVEALSVKPYSKLPKHFNEGVPQCYICLAEYEGGDEVRVLPCHHEFHKLCIDKWLKKLHRICPVCRGDVCKPGSSRAER